ncbi:MAG: histidine phosphatase family protein [Solirubrobacterales bacterium]
MPTLLLVRHAQASFGAGEYDRLSPLGRRQAEVLSEALERRGIRPARLLSGPRRRQRETAAVIGERRGLDPRDDEAWDEYDADAILGAAGAPGLDGSDLDRRRFQLLLDEALLAWVERPEGGWSGFRDRATAAAADLAGDLGRGETAVVVTSAGVIAAIACALLDLPPAAFVALNRVAVNTAVTVVAVGSSPALLSFNEHAHLGAAGSDLLTYR